MCPPLRCWSLLPIISYDSPFFDIMVIVPKKILNYSFVSILLLHIMLRRRFIPIITSNIDGGSRQEILGGGGGWCVYTGFGLTQCNTLGFMIKVAKKMGDIFVLHSKPFLGALKSVVYRIF